MPRRWRREGGGGGGDECSDTCLHGYIDRLTQAKRKAGTKGQGCERAGWSWAAMCGAQRQQLNNENGVVG